MAVLYTILIILAVVLTAFAILLFTKLRLIISVGNSGIYIKICKFGFDFTVPLDKMKKNSQSTKSEDLKKLEKLSKEDGIMKKFLDMRNNFMRQKKAVSGALGYLKGKIFLNEVGFIGKFGTGNTITGGVAYGSVCAFVNTVAAFAGNFFVFEKPPVINVDFMPQEAVFEIKSAFLIDAKPFHIIKAFLIYKKILTKES